MSLFVCTKCRAVENTALSSFWTQGHENRGTDQETQRLCSECLTGKWHGKFPKREWDHNRPVQWLDGEFISASTSAALTSGERE